MPKRVFRLLACPALIATVALGAWTALPAWSGEGTAPGQIGSGVVTWAQASSRVSDWGEMRTYFRGETRGTTSAFAAVAVVKPGEAVHPAHRHAEEEYMVITEGSGRWHLDGKEFPAARGDVLHVSPWVMHGLVNTGDVPLTFFVVKWSSRGIAIPPAPPGPHGQ
jgi:mannose-6-phosphate isomerase-like protein (cupin superfamily)